MRVWIVSLCVGVALSGCQAAPTHSGDSSEYRTMVHPRDAPVSVAGTPFYLAFKGVTCAVSAVIAAPLAGISAVSESRFAPEIREGLGDGLRQNCGPPYVLSPYRVVSVEPAPDVPRMPPPRQPPPPRGTSDFPPALRSLEPALGPPDMPTPAHPSEPPAHLSWEPLTDASPQPWAGGPIELFRE
jgi:hypothetical protein